MLVLTLTYYTTCIITKQEVYLTQKIVKIHWPKVNQFTHGIYTLYIHVINIYIYMLHYTYM